MEVEGRRRVGIRPFQHVSSSPVGQMPDSSPQGALFTSPQVCRCLGGMRDERGQGGEGSGQRGEEGECHAVFSIFAERAPSNRRRIPISRTCTAWTQAQKPRKTCAHAHDNHEKMGMPDVCTEGQSRQEERDLRLAGSEVGSLAPGGDSAKASGTEEANDATTTIATSVIASVTAAAATASRRQLCEHAVRPHGRFPSLKMGTSDNELNRLAG